MPDGSDLLPITEVERQTGIRQATLRMWEKRYGFPRPLRDQHGVRVYPLVQVERLQVIRRLLAQGFRPGKILSGAMELEEFRPVQAAHSCVATAEQVYVFELLRAYRLGELHSHFQQLLLDLGLRRFAIEFLGPLAIAVGEAWSRGELPVRSEHLFAQLAASILHAKQAAVRTRRIGRPKAVLATLTGETHGLGIMMAEAVMAAHGAECIQLGTDVPASEVVAAASETGADIVALSFSAGFPRKSVARLLIQMRAALAPAAALWAGGAGADGLRHLPSGVNLFTTLDDIEPAIARWRASAAAVLKPSALASHASE
jgi:MerR family transcriptional regulator, light-induced transcriptional regulator